MSCNFPLRDYLLDAYIQGDLTEQPKSEFEKHLFTCSSCRQDLILWDHAARLIKAEGRTLFNKTSWLGARSHRSLYNIKRHWLRAGAGLAGATVAAMLMLFLLSSGDPVNQKDVFPPYLEEMVGQVQRSSTLDKVYPQPGDTVALPVRFEWQSRSKKAMTLVLLDHSGDEILRKNIDPGQEQVVLDDPLTTGQYYYKLESADDLLYVGKFTLSGQRE